LQAVGSAFTVFDGQGADDLRRAILTGSTTSVNGRYPSLATIGYGNFLRQQWRGIAVTPRAEGWWPTIKSFLRLPKR